MKILIANRGEIARRVIRTARGLGYRSVAVYADPDADAPFVAEADEAVRIGPASLAESYLSIDKIMEAALSTGAVAIHPGYGFLSENSAFAQAVIDAGLVWVGPHPRAIDEMGLKIAARRHAESAGMPTIPGYSDSQDDADLATAAADIGFPVLVKASAGGGGRGIRIANSAAEFPEALDQARAEAQSAFGNPAVLVEKYIEVPRHIEVQILGDKHGHVVHLGTRECSVQRRYQKLLEEAPAPRLDPKTYEQMCSDAVSLGQLIDYDSTGTVEFIVDDADGAYYFLEMNTRLQVEHPVTEAITGIDLVAQQLSSAFGEPLAITQADVAFDGHAIEARINTEDAAEGWAPRTGTVEELVVPPGVRWDSGVEPGSVVSPHYDAMIAKLIVHGADRPAALQKLRGALDQLIIAPIVTIAGFHRWLLDQRVMAEATITTRTLDSMDYLPTASSEIAAPIAAEAWDDASATPTGSGPWEQLGGRRLTPHRSSLTIGLVGDDGSRHEILVGESAAGASNDAGAVMVDRARRRVAVNLGGTTYGFSVPTRSERWMRDDAAAGSSAMQVLAPFPAAVVEVHVSVGDEVAADAPLIVLEAMKMLHTLRAPRDTTIAEVRVAVGDQVESDQVLITFAEADQ